MRFIEIKLPKKIRRKLPNTAKRRKALAEHNAWLEKLGLDETVNLPIVKHFFGQEQLSQ